MLPRHFLDIGVLDAKTLRAIIDWAAVMKRKGRVPKELKVQGERVNLTFRFVTPGR